MRRRDPSFFCSNGGLAEIFAKTPVKDPKEVNDPAKNHALEKVEDHTMQVSRRWGHLASRCQQSSEAWGLTKHQ
ncbi:hypothetical protein NHX12_014453 [Muraenolepis orangiensis]|uniref:Uncharacterized protein n=1 Tax=Muraenolepis orangiensis TaxID=630683 RepID=A0A9Q0DC51_9TELE|nr:hypothetical protein NHX12_014453 [Muraenolepis orangiensis]